MNYIKIEKDNLLNGPGVRIVLWTAGCEHHCPNCHNMTTWNPDQGRKYTEKTEEKILEMLSKSYISGITMSGGDPLHPYNRTDIMGLCKKIKDVYGNKKTIWLYTGYSFEEVKNLVDLKYIDVLIDGKFINELKKPGLLWKGSENQRVIDVQKTILNNGEIVLYV